MVLESAFKNTNASVDLLNSAFHLPSVAIAHFLFLDLGSELFRGHFFFFVEFLSPHSAVNEKQPSSTTNRMFGSHVELRPLSPGH